MTKDTASMTPEELDNYCQLVKAAEDGTLRRATGSDGEADKTQRFWDDVYIYPIEGDIPCARGRGATPNEARSDLWATLTVRFGGEIPADWDYYEARTRLVKALGNADGLPRAD